MKLFHESGAAGEKGAAGKNGPSRTPAGEFCIGAGSKRVPRSNTLYSDKVTWELDCSAPTGKKRASRGGKDSCALLKKGARWL